MAIEYDPRKDARNREIRGLSFELINDFRWETAIVGRDDRRDYGEERFWALGFIGKDLYTLVFTPREKAIRVISLRKASRKERLAYGETA
ncbi:MAG: BrnT family toxin [Alphaproteobacteria bacterium]|nr:BrnT family toxin [Alphaproteobacteria bacterium]MBM3624012.1 BrnT family toxin [Alphaproteobacteria bacterium]